MWLGLGLGLWSGRSTVQKRKGKHRILTKSTTNDFAVFPTGNQGSNERRRLTTAITRVSQVRSGFELDLDSGSGYGRVNRVGYTDPNFQHGAILDIVVQNQGPHVHFFLRHTIRRAHRLNGSVFHTMYLYCTRLYFYLIICKFM